MQSPAASPHRHGPSVEPAFILQNISLASRPWASADGARRRQPDGARGRARFPSNHARGALFPNPVGIDGVLQGYCPPYYKNMDAAVDAVVAAKFGANGISRSTPIARRRS
jgi:hypothetical protein